MEDTITIRHGNTDGTLVLSDNGFSSVDLYTRIRWIIDPSSNVASIDKIHKKHNLPIIFILGPSRDGKSWTGKVMFRPNKVYEYYIDWTEKGTSIKRTYDPKIAIRPTFDFLWWLIILFIFGSISLFTTKIIRRKLK